MAYIDRDDFFGSFPELDIEPYKSFPTADVVERRRGEWIPILEVNENGEPYQVGVYCSECGDAESYEPYFCPNCGADMR